MNGQVRILDVQRQGQALSLNRTRKRGRNVEVECVTEFILLRRAAGFNAGGHIACVVSSETRLAERAKNFAQRLETEKIEALIGDFKPCLLSFASLPPGR